VKLKKTMERTEKRRNPSEIPGDSKRRGNVKVIAVFVTEVVVLYRRNVAGRRVEKAWQTFSVLSVRSRIADVGTR
jgi:hypothetical protein